MKTTTNPSWFEWKVKCFEINNLNLRCSLVLRNNGKNLNDYIMNLFGNTCSSDPKFDSQKKLNINIFSSKINWKYIEENF
jgi:hypothetical protein